MTETLEIGHRARALLEDTVVWDNHGCMPMRADESYLPQLERYRRSGVDIVSLNVGFAELPLLEHLRVLSYMRQWLTARPEHYRLISSVTDIRRCKADGKLGITFDVEGMCPVQDDPSFVQTFYELGVRWMLIAYNQNNKAGGGCLDVDGGLTAVGRAVIDEMQRVGMVLCLSHAGARTVAEALDYARGPVIFSHSNPAGAWDHPRNVSDELLRACARKGGVVGLNGIGMFLGPSARLAERLFEHLRYVIDLIGPEHVGLSLDYVFDTSDMDELFAKHPQLIPKGMDASSAAAMVAPESVPEIAERLARTSLSDAQIRGILGGNWLRIATQVWRPVPVPRVVDNA
jgi:membrane dipeptidase